MNLILNFFSEFLAGRCGSVVARERELGTTGPGSRPGLTLDCDFVSFL